MIRVIFKRRHNGKRLPEQAIERPVSGREYVSVEWAAHEYA